MIGLFVYDRALSDSEISAVSNYLKTSPVSAPTPAPTSSTVATDWVVGLDAKSLRGVVSDNTALTLWNGYQAVNGPVFRATGVNAVYTNELTLVFYTYKVQKQYL